MKQLVLASSSPARKEVLETIGLPFIVDPSNYQENMNLKIAPKELAKHLSIGKAKDVAARHKNAIVLAADSFAVFDDELLGKPHTLKNARKMLSKLSDRRHSFITGFTIIDTDTQKQYSEVIETKVYFRKLTEEEINGYLKKENVLNNAGAYIIQKLGATLVEKIDGDYSNVMGLPISPVIVAFRDFGINVL